MSSQKPQNQLSALIEALYVEGQPCDNGCHESDVEKMVELCRHINDKKYYCTISWLAMVQKNQHRLKPRLHSSEFDIVCLCR